MLECTSINIDGLDLISDKYYFTLQGLFGQDNTIITNQLFSDGESYNRTKRNTKKPLLNGYVKTLNIFDFMALRKVLLNKKLKTFIVTIPVIGKLTFKAEIESWGEGSIGGFTISCTLKLPDPNIYEYTAHTIQLGILQSASAVLYPVTYPITYGNPTGASGTITNLGITTGYPIITIVGTCSNLVVTNQTTGENMSINISLGPSDTLIIDNTPSNRGIYLNGVQRMDLKNGSWLSCLPGDNIFLFSRSSLESKLHCTISFQGVWV
jgi:hypothetical protein